MLVARASEWGTVNGRRRVARQAGFGLIELIGALMLTMLLAIWQAARDVEAARDEQASGAGVWLRVVRDGVEQMLGTHYDALAEGRVPRDAHQRALFADPTAPTLAELTAGGHLPPAFPAVSPLGFGARISVSVAPACPNQGCRLDALVMSSQPVRTGSPARVDSMAIAKIMGTLTGTGAAVHPLRPSLFQGQSVSLPNPSRPGGWTAPTGTVAAWAGFDRNSALQFLRVGDTRDPQFQGGVSVVGPLSAGTINSAGRIAGQVLAAKEAVHAGTHFQPEATHEAGRFCALTGSISRDGSGATLACQTGRWQALSDGFGGVFTLSEWRGCKSFGMRIRGNPRTGDCSCPPGYRALDISTGRGEYHEADFIPFLCIR